MDIGHRYIENRNVHIYCYNSCLARGKQELAVYIYLDQSKYEKGKLFLDRNRGA